MKGMISRRSALVGLLLPLPGCQSGADVILSGTPGALNFRLRRAGLAGGPLGFPGSLSVYRAADPSRPVWRIATDRLSAIPDLSSIDYGTVPAGARELAPAVRLESGVIYRVEISGGGYLGGRYFAFLDGKLLTVAGTGDASLQAIISRSGITVGPEGR